MAKSTRSPRRAVRILRAGVDRIASVLMIVGGALNGARSGDPQARDGYLRRNREFRP